MFGLRFVSLAVATLLFGNAVAAPVPYRKGDIVYAVPAQTIGGTSVGVGGHKSHPHIVLGHDKQQNVILAPVTHHSSDYMKPHMPVPANSVGLEGVIRLDHIVAHPNNVQPSTGRFKPGVSSAVVKLIEKGQELVKAHRNAADHHDLTAQAHRDTATYHDDQAALHKTGNTQLSNHHASQAALHRGHANAHDASANHHRNAAQAVNGPNHVELKHVRESKRLARTAHKELSAAARHRQNPSELDAAAKKHNYAMSHSQNAVHHANQATAHVHSKRGPM